MSNPFDDNTIVVSTPIGANPFDMFPYEPTAEEIEQMKNTTYGAIMECLTEAIDGFNGTNWYEPEEYFASCSIKPELKETAQKYIEFCLKKMNKTIRKSCENSPVNPYMCYSSHIHDGKYNITICMGWDLEDNYVENPFEAIDTDE